MRFLPALCRSTELTFGEIAAILFWPKDFPEARRRRAGGPQPATVAAKLIARTDRPVFQPELPFEKTGQNAGGTTFAEGLVWFRSRWFLYYGCADSMAGVAIAGAQP